MAYTMNGPTFFNKKSPVREVTSDDAQNAINRGITEIQQEDIAGSNESSMTATQGYGAQGTIKALGDESIKSSQHVTSMSDVPASSTTASNPPQGQPQVQPQDQTTGSITEQNPLEDPNLKNA